MWRRLRSAFAGASLRYSGAGGRGRMADRKNCTRAYGKHLAFWTQDSYRRLLKLWQGRTTLYDGGEQRREFAALRQSELKTARAWALKETAMALYNYVNEKPARMHFRCW